jgi:hypothetical protein
METAAILFITLVMAGVHAGVVHMRFLDVVPRNRMLSAAGGAAVAYVFLHVMPDLAAAQKTLEAAAGSGPFAFIEHHAYLASLAGLLIFFALEHVAQRVERKEHPWFGHDELFWVHMISYGAYNVLIGYLLWHREEPGWAALALFGTAMVLHFLTTDFGLFIYHRDVYIKAGRWVLVGALLLGCALGWALELKETITHLLFAFLAGSVVMNVLKEELPEQRRSRLWPLLGGALGYGLLMLWPR